MATIERIPTSIVTLASSLNAVPQKLKDSSVLERTLSAIEHTRADLAEHKKTLVIIINTCFSFVNPTLGGTVESKNTTFVVSKPFRTLFYCKFCFFMYLIDFSMFFVIMRG